MSDVILDNTATFSATLHLSAQQVEAFRAVGLERNSFVDWEGHYTSLPDLRQIGLLNCVLGFWRLTSVGRQAYEQMFNQQAA